MKLKIDKDTCSTIVTPAPDIAENALPEPVFAEDGTAISGGLMLDRAFIRDENGCRVKLKVTNVSSKPIKLKNLIPIEITSLTNSKQGEEYWSQDIQVFRLARQKNDIPGYFNPAEVDDATRDALFNSEKISAGEGLSFDQMDSENIALPHIFHSDPGLFIQKEISLDSPTLFIGFCGQSRHLCDVELTTDHERKKLIKITASAQFDNITIFPGESRETHELFLWIGSESKLKSDYLKSLKELYHPRNEVLERNIFCSWYFYGPEVTEQDILDNLVELKKKPLPLDVIQIDMGWDTAYGDWLANEKFPHGMEFLAKKIREAGFVPGIWTCPFIIQPDADILNRYPDIRLKNHSGQYTIFKCIRGSCFIVDPFAESAQDYFDELFGRLKSQGFTYHKLDFLRAVFIDEDSAFADPGKNRAEAYRHGLQMIRDILGEECIINACGGLFEGSTGLCDINRSGADNRGHWEGLGQHIASYKVRIKQNISRNFYNYLWRSDPDALQLRRRSEAWKNSPKKHLSVGLFNDDEAFSTVVNQFLGGGIACISENLAELCTDRRELYWRLMPMEAPPAKIFNYEKGYLPNLFSTAFEKPSNGLPSWVVVTMANWNDDADDNLNLAFRLRDVPDLPLAEEYAAFNFNDQSFLGIFKPDDHIEIIVPKRSCRIIRLTPLSDACPLLIGTNLNISCGTEVTLKNSEYHPSEKLTLNPPEIEISILKKGNNGYYLERTTLSRMKSRQSTLS
jgi:hypothetical protein